MAKAVVLMSGGLDSMLAARLVKDQGVEVSAIHFNYFFHSSRPEQGVEIDAQKACAQIDVPLEIRQFDAEILPVVLNPEHGYGSHLNPCIDCRLFNLRRAREYMDEIGADFLVTGEVVGQRPMSQRRDAIQLIDKATGFGDLILRPLSAKLLPPTRPERDGLVDRSKLLDISGRSRKRQMALAEQMGLAWYASPAGGCLLTDEHYARRLKEAIDSGETITPRLGGLLRLGRHFRNPANGQRLVIGRNQEENQKLIEMAGEGQWIVEMVDIPGPVALVPADEGGQRLDLTFITSLMAFYTKKLQPGTPYQVTIRAADRPGETALHDGKNIIFDIEPYQI